MNLLINRQDLTSLFQMQLFLGAENLEVKAQWREEDQVHVHEGRSFPSLCRS
jgi:hypothetical protein